MNSRDAAYDYSSMFATATSTAGGDDDMRMDDTVSPPTSRSGDSRSRRRGKRVAEDDDDESPAISTTGAGRSHKRRRASNETEDRPESLAETTAPTSTVGRPKNKRTTLKRSSGGRDDSELADGAQSKDADSSDNQHGNTTPLLDGPPAGHGRPGRRPHGAGAKRKHLAKSDRVDSEEPPTPTLRRAPQGMEEMIRPARARIPQARSGLNEMRKRVGAILEYVGRLQADVTPTGTQTPSATPGICQPFICPRALGVAGTLLIVADDPEVIEKPDMENSPSVVIMEYLTKRCLDFEVKFGKYPGRYG
jgi:hypothetical protein